MRLRKRSKFLEGLGNIGVGKYTISKNGMAKPKVYYGTIWKNTGIKITEQQYKELLEYAEESGIKLFSFQNFDGDVSIIYNMIDNACSVIDDLPKLSEGKTRLQIHNSFSMADDDFAQTIGNKIFINNFAFRDRELLTKEYDKLEKEKWFVKGTDYNSIIYHEMGHVVANVYGLSPMKIAREVTGLSSDKSIIDYVLENLSIYSSSNEKGREIISEVFSSIYSKINNEFALKYFDECSKIIAKRGV